MQNNHWSSRLAFILASAGAAVGLGNVWRFPYITGQNGGGAFVLMYLGFVFALGIPLMMSEVLVGRRGGHNPAFSFRKLALAQGKSRWWFFAGALPILSGFLILSYYTVIAGWVLDFLFHSLIGTFNGTSVTAVHSLFTTLLANPMQMLFWNTLVVFATITVIALGIHKGLENTVYVMFPLLAILAVVLILYALESGSFMQGVEFLFRPDFSKITFKSALLALGQAFFSLSIGTGIMLTYGKYVQPTTSILKTSVIISLTDTGIALIAGLTIFPIVFATGLEPSSGPSLIFKTLPVAFGQMPFGAFFAALFFLMLEMAAFTSAIALLEPTVVFLMEKFNWSRPRATLKAGFVIWLLGLGSILSFNIGKSYTIFGLTFFELLDYTTANIMLPLGGILVAIFTGWIMLQRTTADELKLKESGIPYKIWRIATRYIAPFAIVVILVSSLQ